MNVVISLLFLVAGLVTLGVSSSKAIDYSIRTAQLFGVSRLFIGFVLLAISTGLPELFVALQATLLGKRALSAGDIIGSNFVDISLSFGIALACLGPVAIPNSVDRKKQFIMLGVSALLMFFVFAVGQLTRPLGFLLLFIYLVAIVYFWLTRRETFTQEAEEQLDLLQEQFEQLSRRGVLVRLGGFLLLVLFASKVCVDSALIFAEYLALPLDIIGVSIVAVGTSLPEISLNIQALRKKNASLALGNSLGSVFEQGALILGLLAVSSQTPLPLYNLRHCAPFMFAAYGLLGYYLLRGTLFTRLLGCLLISCYVLFLLYELTVILR